MFEDGRRWPFVGLAVGVLVVLLASWTVLAVNVPVGYRSCQADPASCEGRALTLVVHDVVAVDDARHYRLGQGSIEVPVEGPTEGLELGTSLTVGGTFRVDDSVVVEQWREPHPWRGVKKALGVFGLLWLAVALPRWFTWQRGLVLRG